MHSLVEKLRQLTHQLIPSRRRLHQRKERRRLLRSIPKVSVPTSRLWDTYIVERVPVSRKDK